MQFTTKTLRALKGTKKYKINKVIVGSPTWIDQAKLEWLLVKKLSVS